MDANRLATLPLFETLTVKQREDVARRLDVVEVAEGKHLADHERLAYEFAIILHGIADVVRGDDHLRTLSTGDFFGEIGLLQTERRTATVVARTNMTLAVMTDRDFRAMVRQYPEVGARIEAAARERILR